jgi:hypothetical protein
MDKMKIITDSDGTEYAVIEHADGSFTSMLKSTYDAQQAQKYSTIETGNE